MKKYNLIQISEAEQKALYYGDHEVILFRGQLIPVLGTVCGTAEQSRETARNIERFIARAANTELTDRCGAGSVE